MIAPLCGAKLNHSCRTDEALSKVSLLESKYLGGDMEHTHLVKGLDYALLEKVRSEMHKETEQDEEQEGRLSRRAELDKLDASVEFRTASGRAIHRLLFRNRGGKNSQMFIPGVHSSSCLRCCEVEAVKLSRLMANGRSDGVRVRDGRRGGPGAAHNNLAES